MGALGFGAYQVLWTLGLTQITAGDSALLIAASPVFVALLAGAVGMDVLSPPKIAGALISFAGVAVIIAAGHELSLGASLLGDALTLGAAALWAVYTTAGARIMRSVDPLPATVWTVVGGAIVLAPFGRRGRRPTRHPRRSPCRLSSRSCTPVRSPRGSPTCSCSTRSGSSARPA